MVRLPQSVTKRVVLKAYLASDHVTAATGKTIAIVISKNGGAFGNPSGGVTNATEIANGWYYVDLSVTDTGTLGPLVIRGTVALVDDVEVIFEVADAFNAGFTGVPGVAAGEVGGVPLAADASGRVDVIKLNGTSQTARDIGASVLVGDKTGFSLSTAGVLAIWHQLTSAIVTASTIGKLIVDFLDATVSSRLSDKTGFSLVSGYDPAKTASQAGDAMALTSGERTTLAGVIWANATRTLSSFGTLVADTVSGVWGAATRSLTDKADFTLSAAYDAAKTAGDATAANQTTINTNVLTRLATSGYTAPPPAVANADALLGRNLAGGSDGGRMVKDALRPMRNKVTVVGTTITVYAEDDVTIAWTGVLTTNPAAEPITAVDPA
jgi:hypothetical protein